MRRLGRGALCLCFVVCVWWGQRCIDFFGEGAIKVFSGSRRSIIWIPVDPWSVERGAMIESGDDACLTTQRPQIFPLTPTSSASLAMLTHHTFSPEPQRCPNSFSSRGPPTVHLIPFRFSPSTTRNTANVPPHPIQKHQPWRSHHLQTRPPPPRLQQNNCLCPRPPHRAAAAAATARGSSSSTSMAARIRPPPGPPRLPLTLPGEVAHP